MDPQEVFDLFERRLVAYSKTEKPKQARSIYCKCKLSSKNMAVFFVASNRILEKLAETQREYSVYRTGWSLGWHQKGLRISVIHQMTCLFLSLHLIFYYISFLSITCSESQDAFQKLPDLHACLCGKKRTTSLSQHFSKT